MQAAHSQFPPFVHSALAAGNIGQELRQALTEHRSAEMNILYTLHQMQALRNAVSAIERLPLERGHDGKSI